MTTETTKADKLAAEYRPTMTLEVLHSWAAEAAALLRANAAVVPDGWKLTQKATCYQLTSGNTVVASLVGPEAEENAAKLATLLAAPSAPVLAEPQQPCQACINGEPTCKPCGKGAQQPVQGGGDAATDPADLLTACIVGLASALHRVKAGKTDGALDVITTVRNLLIKKGQALATPPAQPAPQAPALRQFLDAADKAGITHLPGDFAERLAGLSELQWEVLRQILAKNGTFASWMMAREGAAKDATGLDVFDVFDELQALGLMSGSGPCGTHYYSVTPCIEDTIRQRFGVGHKLDQVMAVAKVIHATSGSHEEWAALRQYEVDTLRNRATAVLNVLRTTPPSPVAQPEALPVQGDDVREAAAAICDQFAQMLEDGAGPVDQPSYRLRQAARDIRSLAAPQPAAARVGLSETTSHELIAVAIALEQCRILEEIKAVSALQPVDDMPTPYQAAWRGACEEAFFRATYQQWHMDEDASRFTRESAHGIASPQEDGGSDHAR